MNPDDLSRWARDPRRSCGRRIAEPPESTVAPRNEHQRDRDRIVHSTAFRRLVYKTQVFINHEGDLFRTRLTHSLEVAQLARSMARALRLNEDLVEAIALAHDLGHTPFGHAGQDALQACMAAHGGFEHNLQSLRVVDLLEARYAAFDGLNLTFETREGILKHCSRANAERLLTAEPDGPALRFVRGGEPSLEAQLVNLADEMAYSAHDVDDGVRSGLLDLEQLQAVPLLARSLAAVQAEHPGLNARRSLHECLRRVLSAQVADLIACSAAAMAAADSAACSGAAIAPLEAGAEASPTVGVQPRMQTSAAMRDEALALKRFLFGELYRHPRVRHMTQLAYSVVTDLFAAYFSQPAQMTPDFAADADRPRAVADYIAGMTDRFALREHQRLTGQRLFSV